MGNLAIRVGVVPQSVFCFCRVFCGIWSPCHMTSDSDSSSDSSSETGSDWTGRPLRADYGGESQARFEASMKTVSQIWHIGWGRHRAICTMPGKKMLSKFKAPTQNKTAITTAA